MYDRNCTYINIITVDMVLRYSSFKTLFLCAFWSGNTAGLLRNICDICSMFPIVLKGRKRGLDKDDIPKTPTSFDLLFESNEVVANMIDASAASLLMNKDSEWPLLARMCLEERRALVIMALTIGVIHGFVNSIGRFILLQAAINAVVDDAPMQERLSHINIYLVMTCSSYSFKTYIKRIARFWCCQCDNLRG